MASNTEFLELLKKDPVTDASDTFNITTMLNENWDKVDLFAKGALLFKYGYYEGGSESVVIRNLNGIQPLAIIIRPDSGDEAATYFGIQLGIGFIPSGRLLIMYPNSTYGNLSGTEALITFTNSEIEFQPLNHLNRAGVTYCYLIVGTKSTEASA